jgi:hypothetical protein
MLKKILFATTLALTLATSLGLRTSAATDGASGAEGFCDVYPEECPPKEIRR